MASVEKLPSGKWRGVYRTAEGKRRSKSFAHKAAAQRWATAQEHDVRDKGSLRDPARGRMRWGAWAEEWWPSRGLSAGAERSQRILHRRYVEPRWGDVELRAIEHLAVQSWVIELGRALSASSVRQAFYQLSASMKAAVRAGHVETNPCSATRLPTLPPAPERYLRREESDRLIAAMMHPEHRVLAEVLFESGLRIGEAVALHRHRVDFDRGVIDVVEAYDQAERIIRPYPKSKQSRSVPLSDHLAGVLLEHLQERPARGRCGFEHAPGSPCHSPLVIVGPNGALCDPHNYTNRTWQVALSRAELGRARVHDARHSYASRVLAGGVSLARLQLLLGHDSITTTMRYAHLVPDANDEVRSALARSPRGTERGTLRAVKAVNGE